MPAQQRLDPDASIGREIELRLVVQLELVALERATHLALELPVALHFGIEIEDVETNLAAALLLGPIERAISPRHQLVRVVATLRKVRDTDADPDADFAVSDAERLGHELDEPVREVRGPRRACDVRGDDGELVAAEPCEGVTLADRWA